MAIIIVDGPEKAGKTTLIQAIGKEWCHRMGVGSIARRYPWGPVKDDVEYKQGLSASMLAHQTELVIWDRSWASEHVYGLLLSRPGRRLAADPWLGEWLYGRAVQTMGLRVMVSSSWEERHQRRDASDLDVHPQVEGFVFDQYAEDFGWHLVENDYRLETRELIANEVVSMALANFLMAKAVPPEFAGPPTAPVVVVGEVRNDESTFPGAWLPLATPLTTNLGRSLGNGALELAWTNSQGVPPAVVRGFRGIVALGEKAHGWVRYQVGREDALELPHPAWAYRYGAGKNVIPTMEKKLLEFVKEHSDVEPTN